MPKKLRSLFPYTIITCCILGGLLLFNNLTAPTTSYDAIYIYETSTSDDVNQAFEAYTYQLFVDEISCNTLQLYFTLDDFQSYGITDYLVSFGTFSTDASESIFAIENQLVYLSMFSYEELTEENQLTYDVIQDALTTSLLGTNYTLFYEPLSPYTGLQTQLPIVLAEFPLDSEDDILTYLQLLETLPDYFESLLTYEQAKSAAGLFMSDTQLDTVLEDCYGFINMEENYLLSTFDNRIAEITTLSETVQQTYSNENAYILSASVIPAYESLIQGLEDLRNTSTNDMGLCYYEYGRNYYAYLVLANTGSSRTIPEIQVLIEEQMLEDLLDLQEAYTTLGTTTFETSDIEGSPEEILTRLEESMSRLYPEAPDVTITIHDVPSELEDFLSPAFYLIPTIDNAYDNTIYINNAYMTDSVTLYTTLAHEGYPGHLYQNTYFAATDPDAIRSLFNYGGYSEGWATYVEMCSYYLGELSSPEDMILQKNASLNLGLYAYIDIGIHYEGWSLSDVTDYLSTYGITNSETSAQIYDLIIATPSNYLKYYLGYLEILELKKECIEAWGEDFSQLRFHEAVLEAGPTSFDILHKYILE